MGKKDTITKGTNVENYRKRIGKQDYKKSKGALKAVKDIAEVKRSATGLQDTVLVAIAFAVALAFVYAILYLSMSKYQEDGQ